MHDNGLTFVVLEVVVVVAFDSAAFVLQVFHCTSSGSSDDNQFQVVLFLLVLYNYLIYNYYYTHTRALTQRAAAWQRNAAWAHNNGSTRASPHIHTHTIFTFVLLAAMAHVIQHSLTLTLSHAPSATLSRCLPPPLLLCTQQQLHAF